MLYFWILVYLFFLWGTVYGAGKIPPKGMASQIAVGSSFLGILLYLYLDKYAPPYLINHLGHTLFYLVFSKIWVGWFGVFFFLTAAKELKEEGSQKATRLLGYVITGFYALYVTSFVFSTSHENLNNTLPEKICMQSTGYSCSPASLVNFLKLYDIPATEREMAQLAHTRPNLWGGTNMEGIYYALYQKVGTRYNIHCRRGNIQDLEALQKPSIISLRLQFYINHSVVVEKFESSRFYVLDPLLGKRELPSSLLERDWLGEFIYLEKIR